MTPEHTNPVFFRVDPSSGTPLYQQVVDGVADAVAAGRLRAGDALPSVRALAVELRINLNTVSRAYARLQELGLAEARRGVGLFIAAEASADSVEERLRRLDPTLAQLVEEARRLGLPRRRVVAYVRKVLERDLP